MSIVRPKSTDGARYLGHQVVAITGIEDKSRYSPEPMTDKDGKMYDICLVIQFAIKDNEYPNSVWLIGNLERDDGEVRPDQSVLKRIYSFFDAIGFEGGINNAGEWEDKDGKVIEGHRILSHIGYCIATNPLLPTAEDYKYRVYIYKRENKSGKNTDKKAYTTIYPRFWKNDAAGEKDAMSYIEYMIRQKFLIEYNGPMGNTKSGGSPSAGTLDDDEF